MRRRLAPTLLMLASCAGAAEGRDVVPESRDVRVVDASAPSSGPDGYEYVAKRALATVGLAEARGIDGATARAAIDRVADALDTCATERGRRGTLAPGAARVVAEIDGNGSVAGTSLRVEGQGVLENAVMCLVAPLKLLAFPANDGGARGMAIEAVWGTVTPKP
jgi:hypothetical protein